MRSEETAALDQGIEVQPGKDDLDTAKARCLEILERGVDAWNRWRGQNRGRRLTLARADLRDRRLPGVRFDEVDLTGVKLRRASLDGSYFIRANLGSAELNSSSCRGCRFDRADLRKAKLSDARLSRSRFTDADLRDASLPNADLRDVNLQGADLRGARLNGADLTGAVFHRVRLDRTKLEALRFDPSHLSLHDGSNYIQVPTRDRMLNWGALRAVGTVPLFEVSYLGLALVLIVTNGIAYLNQTEVITAIDYPIPIPRRMTWFLIATLLLVVGTTLHRVLCPPRVRQFSETEWVESLGRPRLQYLSESFRRRGQISTLVLTAAGGILGLVLVGERLVIAFRAIFWI